MLKEKGKEKGKVEASDVEKQSLIEMSQNTSGLTSL